MVTAWLPNGADPYVGDIFCTTNCGGSPIDSASESGCTDDPDRPLTCCAVSSGASDSDVNLRRCPGLSCSLTDDRTDTTDQLNSVEGS